MALRIGRRELVAGGVLTATAGVLVAAALAFASGAPAADAPAPVGQEIVLDSAVRSTDSSVASAEATSSASTAAPGTSAPGTVPGVTAQQHQPLAPANEPEPDPVEPTQPTTDPVEPTQPTTNPAGEVTAPAPPPDRCWMDNSDPWNYPNGRMICEPATP